MKCFDDIYGYAEVKRELSLIAECLREPERFRRLGAHMPSGLLLTGQPGLGKTLMAQALIQASNLPSFVCRKEKRSDNMLETIRTIFDEAAKAAPSIILLDDMDKYSNCTYELRDTEEYVTVQTCIDGHKDEGVFVIATANNPDKLPQSLLRAGRFDRIIELHPSHGEDVVAICAHYLEGISCTPNANERSVACILDGSSCALIETTINEASLLAGFEGARGVSLKHFVRAYVRAEGGGALSELSPADPTSLDSAWASERAQVAFHEAGHVIVQEELQPGSASLAAIVGRKGRLGGLAKSNHDVPPVGTFAEARKGILVSLAGGLAVERKYGIPCIGCRSDNEEAMGTIKKLLTDASLLGPTYTGQIEWSESNHFEEACERACSVVIQQLQWEVREILARRWQSVERIAELLYLNGYVLPQDVALSADLAR